MGCVHCLIFYYKSHHVVGIGSGSVITCREYEGIPTVNHATLPSQIELLSYF